MPLCKPREHRKPVNRQLFFIADVSMKNGIAAPMMPIADADTDTLELEKA